MAAALILSLALAGGGWAADRPAAVSVVDDSGATVRLAQPARRIVSLAPHLTEDHQAGQRWQSIGAVARGNLFFVPPDLIQRHTPRLLDGAERLCQHLETARSRRPAN
jgi:ABC-type Fe3+-hydroxamate transport system substrate-binding protein